MADALHLHPHAIIRGKFHDAEGAVSQELVNPPVSLERGDRITWSERDKALRYRSGKFPPLSGPLVLLYVPWTGEGTTEVLRRIIALEDPIELPAPASRAEAFALVCALAYGLTDVLTETHEDDLVVWTVAS